MKVTGLSKSDFPFSKSYMKALPIWLGFLFFLPFCRSLLAQNGHLPTQFLTGLSRMPQGKASDSLKRFENRSLLIGCRIPLWKAMRMKENDFIFNTLYLSHASTLGKWTTPWSRSDLSMWGSFTQLTLVHKGQGKGFFVASAGFRTWSDLPVSRFSLAPQVSVLYFRKTSGDFSWTLGAAYSFLFGRGLPLPILGFQYQLSSDQRIQVVLPFRIHWSVRHRGGFQSRFALHPRSHMGLVHFDSTSAFLRHRSLSLGYFIQYKPDPSWAFGFGISALGGRRLWLTKVGPSQVLDGYNQKLPGTLWLEFQLRYRFGQKKPRKEAELLPDLNEYSIEDLEEEVFP
jgi:hypothetical protein